MDQDCCANKSSAGGTDKSGVFHWLMQRVTAILLIPLPFWMVIFLNKLMQSSPEQVAAWVSAPANSAFFAVSALAAVYHTVLGMQSIFDDYISSERCKTVAMWGVKLILLITLCAVFFALWWAGSIQ